MRNLVVVTGLLILTLNAFAKDSVECDDKQVVNYETTAEIIQTNDKRQLLYLNSGSSRKLYLRMNVEAVDSRTLKTIEQDVTGHYTKKAKGITCFKQEVESQDCATYSCNLEIIK